jgi:hypothetical protein
MAPTSIILVDTEDLLERCIADISSTDARPVTKLAIDLEGVELCRFGRIALLQIIAYCSRIIWLVDVTTLGKLAFDHSDAEGRSLRLILESGATKKVYTYFHLIYAFLFSFLPLVELYSSSTTCATTPMPSSICTT